MVLLTAQSACIIVNANTCTITSLITAPSARLALSRTDARGHVLVTRHSHRGHLCKKMLMTSQDGSSSFTCRRVRDLCCVKELRRGEARQADTCCCLHPNRAQRLKRLRHTKGRVLLRQQVINPNTPKWTTAGCELTFLCKYHLFTLTQIFNSGAHHKINSAD